MVVAAGVSRGAVEASRYAIMPVEANSCEGDAPRICVFPEHVRFLASMSASAERMTQGAAEVGASDLLPKELVERLPSEALSNDGRGRLTIPAEAFSGDGSVDPVQVAVEMVTPYHCSALYGQDPPPMKYGENLLGAAAALLTQAGYSADLGVSPLPVQDWKERLAAFRSCQLG